MRHDDEFAACLLDARAVIGIQHGARADQAVGGQGRAHGADAVQRVGRIQRHFDQAKARVVERLADGFGFGGRDAAQDGDQAAVGHGGLQTGMVHRGS
ncbi:hypothetical protein D3C72_1943060 [compost metagenome]